MKKKRLLLLVLCPVLAGLLFACSPKDLVPPEERILGSWAADVAGVQFQALEFKDDGTVVLGGPLLSSLVTGTYEITGGVLSSSPARLTINYKIILVATTVKYDVTFEGDTMTVKQDGGSMAVVYNRAVEG